MWKRVSLLMLGGGLLIGVPLAAQDAPAPPAVNVHIRQQPLTIATPQGTCVLEAGQTYRIGEDWTCARVQEPPPPCQPANVLRVLKAVIAPGVSGGGAPGPPSTQVEAFRQRHPAQAAAARAPLLAAARKVVEDCQ